MYDEAMKVTILQKTRCLIDLDVVKLRFQGNKISMLSCLDWQKGLKKLHLLSFSHHRMRMKD